MERLSETEPAGRRKRRVRVVLSAALVLLALAGGVLLLGDRTPTLDRARLDSAVAAWNEDPIEDYDLVLSVRVDSQDEHRHGVRVRGRRLVSQTLDGLERDADDNAYTIDGLFAILDRELEMVEEGAREGQGGRTQLRVRFHESLGIPVVVKRITSDPGIRSFVMEVESLDVPGAGRLYP